MATGSENEEGALGAGVAGTASVPAGDSAFVEGTTPQLAYGEEARKHPGVAADFGVPFPFRPDFVGFGEAAGVATGVEASAGLSPATGVDFAESSPAPLGAALCRKSCAAALLPAPVIFSTTCSFSSASGSICTANVLISGSVDSPAPRNAASDA